jgi:ribonuclease-3 family protein
MINSFFGKVLEMREANQINPLNLAYIGDAIYELAIREYILENNLDSSVNKLNKNAISYVKASAQCEFMRYIESGLSDEEMAIYKRGRNTKSNTSAKSSSIQEYRVATGFEALIGYLYIIGKYERLTELLSIILEKRRKDLDES